MQMKLSQLYQGKVGGVTVSLLLLSLYCANLSFIRISLTGTDKYLFLLWNLLLAWLPLIFAWLLFSRTAQYGLIWSKRNILWFILWLVFLPNAFYLTTDFVHLRGVFDEPQRLYDIVLFTSYAITGILLGTISVLLVHWRAVQRFGSSGHILPAIALLLSGLAIYFGRYLRWNSWDVVLNPFGLLFDVSDRVINPTAHTLTFSTTLLFFSFYGVLYLVIWRLVVLLLSNRNTQG